MLRTPEYAFSHFSKRMIAVASVVVALSLGVVEPLLCIVHCALWQHALEHRTASQITPALFGSVNFLCSLPDASPTQHAQSGAQEAMPRGVPAMADRSASTPTLVQPQPFHEMLLLIVTLMLVVRFALWPLPPSIPALAQRFVRPLLHPPMRSLSM